MLNHNTQWLTSPPNKKSLHEACAGVCRRFGFQYFLFVSNIPDDIQPRLIIIQGTHEDGSTVCHAHRGVLRISTQANTSSTEIDNLLRHFTRNHKQQLMNVLLSKQVNIPLVNSMGFPVFGESGDIGLLILAASIDYCRSSTTAIPASYAQEFAHSIHQAIIRLVENDPSTDTQQLTKREVECLHWAAGGKTNWEIGKILGVSKRTVVFHLQNSSKKLQTSNRYHTVARAVSLGLINRQS